MPRNGSGSYVLPAGNPVVTQTLITSVWANTTMNDLAAAITQSLSRDGQTVPTGNLPMGGFRHTGAGDPVGYNDYVTLKSLQSNSSRMLSSVVGTNTITGNLPGAQTTFSVGQEVFFTPVANNTGAVTLAVNGSAAAPVLNGAKQPLTAGVLKTGNLYLLVYDGTNWIIVGQVGSASVNQLPVSGWVRPSSGTYPTLSVATSTSVGVPAGTGFVVEPSARDSSDVTAVTWTAQNVTLPAIATTPMTTIGVDATGAVSIVSGIGDAGWMRTHVLLGFAYHPKGAITSVSTMPSIYADDDYLMIDIAALMRGLLLSGGGINGNATNALRLDVSSAQFFWQGGSPNSINTPNVRNMAGTAGLSFYPITQDGTVANPVTDVPVTKYNPTTNTVSDLPTTTSAAIHMLYWIDGTGFALLYGQTSYADLATAVGALGSYSPTIPGNLTNMTFLGYVIAQKNCADLKNGATAKLQFAAKALGGGSSGGGGGGGIPDAPFDGFDYGRQDGQWVRSSPLIQGPAGTDRFGFAYTGNSKRFSWGLTSTPESGSNAGSNLVFRRYDDTGSYLGDTLTINRATGLVAMNVRPLFNGYTPWDNNNLPSPAQTGVGQNVSFGNVTASGDVIASGNVTGVNITATGALYSQTHTSATSTLIVGPSIAGTVYFRPNGPGSSTNEVNIDTTGAVRVYGAGVNLMGNGKTLKVYDNNLDVVCVEVGGGYASATDRTGWIVNRNANAPLMLSGRNFGTILSLGSSAGISTLSGQLTADILYSNGTVRSSQNFVGGTNVVLSNDGSAGTVYLRPNGFGSSTGELSVASNGNVVAGGPIRSNGSGAAMEVQDRGLSGSYWSTYSQSNIWRLWYSTGGDRITVDASGNLVAVGNVTGGSDRILKDNIVPHGNRGLLEHFELFDFTWKSDGKAGVSVIAQDVQKYAPEFVQEAGEGDHSFLAVNKIDLALELIAELKAEIRALKARHGEK